jgi:hypothetical protein
VVITTRKEESLISDLKETFNNLDRYKLKLNPKKMLFWRFCRTTPWLLGISKRNRSKLMTHKYRGSQQSSREVKPKFIDSTQGELNNICKP